MNLDIIVRTHDKDNVHRFAERYCGANKQTVVINCMTSLANSARPINNTNISFTILDDRSSAETLEQLDKIFRSSGHDYKIVNLVNDTDMRVYNYTALRQWEVCRDSEADLVYSVEDDYLHCPTALTEMLDTYKLISKQLGPDICISPLDYTNDYMDRSERCQVGWGSHRHWKTGTHTTNTFMTTPNVFRKYWEPFRVLASEYHHEYWKQDPQINELNTIDQVWANAVPRFSPIPGLALHMQFDEQKDPMIDWEYWWEHYTK